MVRILKLKQITTTTLLGMSLVFALSGCALFKTGTNNASTKSNVTSNTRGTPPVEGASETHQQNTANPDALVIERVPFELGVSSFTVERIAKQYSCQPKKGAGLLYRKSPVEVYRVECEDGREIKARCELRQCEIFKP